MAKIDIEYHKLLNEILDNGVFYTDPNRRDVRRLEIPNYSFYHSFEDGFPALTTKKLALKSIVGETLWILRGDTNIKYLEDNNIPIWRGDAYNHYLRVSDFPGQEFSLMQLKDFVDTIKMCDSSDLKSWWGKEGYNVNYNLGDLGKVYGHQLRRFGSYNRGGDNYYLGFDQLKWLVNEMIDNPLSTKKDITHINPCEKSDMALTCCHTGWSILVHKDLSGFDLEFKLSSSDVFLGLGFNIASYALISEILEKATGLKALGIRYIGNNVHIYEKHLDAVKVQLSRDVNKYGNCKLKMNNGVLFESFNKTNDLDKLLELFDINQFRLDGYESYPRIQAEMLAYNK